MGGSQSKKIATVQPQFSAADKAALAAYGSIRYRLSAGELQDLTGQAVNSDSVVQGLSFDMQSFSPMTQAILTKYGDMFETINQALKEKNIPLMTSDELITWMDACFASAHQDPITWLLKHRRANSEASKSRGLHFSFNLKPSTYIPPAPSPPHPAVGPNLLTMTTSSAQLAALSEGVAASKAATTKPAAVAPPPKPVPVPAKPAPVVAPPKPAPPPVQTQSSNYLNGIETDPNAMRMQELDDQQSQYGYRQPASTYSTSGAAGWAQEGGSYTG